MATRCNKLDINYGFYLIAIKILLYDMIFNV